MSSAYVPIVLKLEVPDRSRFVGSFMEDSNTEETTFRQRVTSASGMKKRSSPGSKKDVPSTSSAIHQKGRRTYSEVVIESLEGDKLVDIPSSSEATPPRSIKSTSEPPPTLDHISYYCGNPLTEKTEGVMHFYKYNDVRLTKASQCRMLCMLAVPAQVTVREIIYFIGASLPVIERIKVVRDATPNQYMLIIKFREHDNAVTFYEEFNNCPFNDFEPHHCVLLFVDKIECTTSEELLTFSSQLTELPTCAVCLERMDESVLAILCNHAFHAKCLEQWTDNTCPVCRYVQTPEVVAEQRCSDCGQSNDLWICLICGNIGCGRYASQHAHRHWELTSHTYSLKVGGERVWDYAGDNYVHRLIENDSDGKLVEYQREGNTSTDEKYKDDKLEGIKLEYTLLLTSQLEDQRKYFEGKLGDVEGAMSKMEKIACAQVESLEKQVADQGGELKLLRNELEEVNRARQLAEKKAASSAEKVGKLTNELRDEQEINRMLRKDQTVWKAQLEKLMSSQTSARAEYEKRIDELKSQVNDLLMHFETKDKLNEQMKSGNVTQEEIVESQVGLNESPNAKRINRRKKK